MAKIFPVKKELIDIPYAELVVYDLLAKLDDTFTVFYSVIWNSKNYKKASVWRENDFLICSKKYGVLVLEVKGGNIKYRDGVFHQINSNNGEIHYLDPKKRNDPLTQAKDGVYHYRNLLDDIEPEKIDKYSLKERFPIEAAVWFPICDLNSKYDEFPLGYREVWPAILGFEDIQKGPRAVSEIFKFYDTAQKANITDKEYKRIVEAIAKDFDLIAAPAATKGELDYEFLKLTNEQMGLLDYISEQNTATIQGVAGTGKTLIAKEAARRFGEENRKVLFLCFNKFLYQYLEHQYPFSNVTYYNIHTFIAKFRLGEDTGSLEKRTAQLQKISWDELDFDDVIIDEAQDFSNDEIIYFKDYAELKEGHFMAFYDKNQLLTTNAVPEWIQNSECKLRLTRNCRNTYEIALTSYNVIDIELKHKLKMVNGDKTSMCFVDSEPIDNMSRLITMLLTQENGYDISDITILSLKSEDNSLLKGVEKIGRWRICHERNNSSLFFTTASKFKGLESRAVIIIDIDEDCFQDEEKKRIFYVACSRARQKLVLFAVGDENRWRAIANIIDNKNRFAPKGRIVMKTQAKVLNL